jgi:isocitrate dehydrogenase (NAD+)
VTLIPGDGIGDEISDAVVRVFAAAKVPVEWERVNLSTATAKPGQPLLSDEVKESIHRNKIALKGSVAIGCTMWW